MKKNILRLVLIILLISVLIMIFNFSNQSSGESSGLSKRITKIIVQTFKLTKGENLIERIIRKMAHLSIYTILGFLVMSLLSTYKLNETNKLAYSQIFGTLYAISDEIHQAFIPGRSAEVTDVMLDSLGVFIGIIIVLFLIKVCKMIKKNYTENTN